MSRTALVLLVVILAGAEVRPAPAASQIIDYVFPPDSPLRQVMGTTCDPSGNVDEIPFDAASVPFEDWLKEREVRQLPMEIRTREPELRMDQQTAVFYQATVRMKSLKSSPDRKMVFFVGVDDASGKRLTETSVHAVNIPPQIKDDFDAAVRGCVYFRPGNYSLWVAAHDEGTGKHSVARTKVSVSGIKNDPLPLLESRIPAARFPDYTPEDTDLSKTIQTPLFVPVSNKRPLEVDIIGLNPFQRDGIGPLTQMDLQDGAISVATLDLETQKVVYDSRTAGAFDFTEMLKAAELHRQDGTIDLRVIETGRDGAGYLRKFLEERSRSANGKARALVVVSSPMAFQRGADLSAIQLEASCQCRLFYVQLYSRYQRRDDLEKLFTSPQSRRLEVTTALEFRKALASIVRELEAF